MELLPTGRSSTRCFNPLWITRVSLWRSMERTTSTTSSWWTSPKGRREGNLQKFLEYWVFIWYLFSFTENFLKTSSLFPSQGVIGLIETDLETNSPFSGNESVGSEGPKAPNGWLYPSLKIARTPRFGNFRIEFSTLTSIFVYVTSFHFLYTTFSASNSLDLEPQ